MKDIEKSRVYNRKYKARKIKERKALGLCTNCGIRPLATAYDCRECADKSNALKRENAKNLRKRVLAHYGAPRCACCKQDFEYEFLHLDHINGGGSEHRRRLAGNNKSGIASNIRVYRELVKLGFPPGYQALCANCNCAKGAYGICPHQNKPKDLSFEESSYMCFTC